MHLPRMVGLALAALLIASAATAVGAAPALREAFEGPDVTWRSAGGDAPHRIEAHQRAQAAAHSGDWCEQLRVTAGNGTFVYLIHDIGRAPVIDELVPSLWLRSDRAGLQLLARVVLPRSTDPRNGRVLTTLIRGSTYSGGGGWEQLRIEGTPQLLERQARVLRSQLGADVDLGEAYVDAVLLNAYGGEGATQLAIDDLEVSGFVQRTPEMARQVVPTAWQPGSDAPTVELVGSLLLVDSRPFFPRAIQYHGESPEFLQRLGFNTLWLTGVPSPELLAEAARLGLWLVAPPPVAEAESVTPIGGEFNRVLAWDVGHGLMGRDLGRIQAWTGRIRSADPRAGRPIVAGVDTELRAHSRHVDILTLDRFPLGSSLGLGDYASWLNDRPKLARPGTPCWATIQTAPARELVDQWLALGIPQPPRTCPPDAIRLLVYTALSSGTRGMLFESPLRLDQPDDAQAAALARSLERINLELDLVEPWVSSGKPLATIAGSVPDTVGTVLQTDRARLLIALSAGRDAQYVPGKSASREVSFVVPAPETHKPYEMTAGGLKPLRYIRAVGGLRVTLDEFSLASLVLLSQDPMVVSGMTARLVQAARRWAQLDQELAAAELAELTAGQPKWEAFAPVAQTTAWLGAAQTGIKRCEQAFARGDFYQASLEAQHVQGPLRLLRHAVWEQGTSVLTSPAENPLAASFRTLIEHGRLAYAMRIAPTGPNTLPAGDCEDLRRMLDAGWRHLRHDVAQVETLAELSPASPHSGDFSLRVSAQPTVEDSAPALLESPPIWIVTPGVEVTRGQVWRIHGWVRVNAPITGSVDGLLILDSLSGPALAERVPRTEGWREFTLYRAATRSGELTLTFALTGLGEFWLDDVSIQAVDVATARAAAPSVPLPEARVCVKVPT